MSKVTAPIHMEKAESGPGCPWSISLPLVSNVPESLFLQRLLLTDLKPCYLCSFDNEFGLEISVTNSLPPKLQDSF